MTNALHLGLLGLDRGGAVLLRETLRNLAPGSVLEVRGHAPDLTKIARFRASIGEAPLALASGITPENAGLFAADVDCFLVATGINHPGDFYNIDPARLAALLQAVGAQEVRHV